MTKPATHRVLRRKRPPGAAGFTLLEILLSLALVAMLLVALTTFIFSMGELWGQRSESRLLDLHARAVTRFLEQQLRLASLPPEVQTNVPPIAAQQIQPQNGSSDNLLTFELPAGCRLFTWQGGPPLPDVICSLQVRSGEGLFLLWHSKLETHFSEDPPREVRITPFVTSMSYDYYNTDNKSWQNQTTLLTDNNNQPETPQRLRLHFAYDKLSLETVIPLIAPVQGLPDY